MNRALIGLLSFCIASPLLAQQDSLPHPYPQAHRLTVDMISGYDSNVLYNDLVTSLYQGKNLDRDTRTHSQDALNGRGRAGYELGFRASYTWGDSLFGKAHWSPRISLAHQSVMGMRFSDAVYDLTFFGNAAYEGQTAALGNSAFEQLAYQTVAFGIEDRRTGTFVELALVNGQYLNTGDIRTADLFTGADGRYLDLDLDGSYHRSDTGSTGFGRSNGMGAAVSLAWHHPLALFGHPALLELGAVDVGFIAWGSRSLQLEKDSTIHYEGIAVSDVLDLDGLLVDTGELQDSLGLGLEPGSFVRPLPFRLHGGLRMGRSKGRFARQDDLLYSLTVDQIYLPGYLPLGTFARRFFLSSTWSTEVAVRYGGFGGLRAGLDVEARLGPWLQAHLQTQNLIGSFSDQAMGRSVIVGIAMRW